MKDPHGRRINIGGYWETPNDAPAWEGTETTCTMHSLNSNTTYYFVVRAFGTSGDESGDSNEVPCGDCKCDLNADGQCDMEDWELFGEDWGRTDCPVPQ